MRTDGTDRGATGQLAVNDFVYRRLLREVDRLHARDDPTLPAFIEASARFAWQAHPGRLADGALENPLLQIGRMLGDGPGPSEQMLREPDAPSRTLHVASEVHATGGHSRILAKWVQRDLSSAHAIILTRQNGPVPHFLTAIAAERQAPIEMLDPSATILERARQLRTRSREFDRVILHQHPDDAVPVIAYAVPGGCPVAMFNHAHFWFSLGGGVADLVINTESIFQRLTERLRAPRATALLVGPPGLDRLSWSEIDKRQAKERLGLFPDAPVAMTIGAESYFTPSGDMDFFATLEKLLEARADLQVLVVGVPADSPLVPAAIRATGRVRLVGPVADPRPYYEAADICLESFPTPSLGAVVEAVAYGQAFPVPGFAAAENPYQINQPRIASLAERRRTEAEYLRFARDVVDAWKVAGERTAALRRTLIHDDETFGDQFAGIYERLRQLGHEPHDLPRTPCVADPDNRVLASATHPLAAREAIGTLPLAKVLTAHLIATVRRHQRPRDSAAMVARQLGRWALYRLPRSIQRRLRRPRVPNGRAGT